MRSKVKKNSPFRSLVDRNEDAVLHRRYLLLKPIRHSLLGVWFQPGNSFSYFWPVRAEMHLCAGIGGGSHNQNDRLSISRPGQIYWSDEAALEELREKIQNEILPDLRRVRTFRDLRFFKMMSAPINKRAWHGYYWYLQMLVAEGDLDLARQIILENIDTIVLYEREMANPALMAMLADMHRIVPLVKSNDIAGLAALLHENEARSIEKAGLKKYWQRTPFPLEEKYL
jgi:hypothetical protein